MRKYVAERTPTGFEVEAHYNEIDGCSGPLDDRGHGFEMGYPGSGPRNLARAILTDAVADYFALDFGDEVIANLPNAFHDKATTAVITQAQVFEWLRQKLADQAGGARNPVKTRPSIQQN